MSSEIPKLMNVPPSLPNLRSTNPYLNSPKAAATIAPRTPPRRCCVAVDAGCTDAGLRGGSCPAGRHVYPSPPGIIVCGGARGGGGGSAGTTPDGRHASERGSCSG